MNTASTETDSDLPDPDAWFREQLLAWFEEHQRDYPWRSSRNPFHVLSAEIMLQRTRADQVEPVYRQLTEVVEGPAGVVERGQPYVDELFSRLGLRWRADHYMSLCRELVERYGGEVPVERDELMSLPGVGQYAAGATLSFALEKPTGVLDSNILRVYGRYFGIEFSDSDRRKKSVLAWADGLVPSNPGEGRRYNLAVVDFAAEVCVPREPKCDLCPLTDRCAYYLSLQNDRAT